MLADRKRYERVRRESTWETCHCLWGHQLAHVPPLGAISLSPSVPLSRPGLIPFPFLHILLPVPATRSGWPWWHLSGPGRLLPAPFHRRHETDLTPSGQAVEFPCGVLSSLALQSLKPETRSGRDGLRMEGHLEAEEGRRASFSWDPWGPVCWTAQELNQDDGTSLGGVASPRAEGQSRLW